MAYQSEDLAPLRYQDYVEFDSSLPESEAGYSAIGNDRIPPQDLAAEEAVLGSMLLSKDAIGDISEIIKGKDFYSPKHEQIFNAIVDLDSSGNPADALTVAEELNKRGQLKNLGGPIFLHDLTAKVTVVANASHYANIVRDKAILRRLVTASDKISQMGYRAQGDVNDIVDAAQQEIYAVSDDKTRQDYASLSDLMELALDEIEMLSESDDMDGVPTGFLDLDELTNGLHPGQMIIVAARPGVGKSTLGLDFARAAAIKHGLCAAFFSLEMTKLEIVMRLISAETQIPLGNVRKGNLSEDEWQRIAPKVAQIAKAPMFIDDSPNMTMLEIRAKARRLKQRHDLKLLVIDYIQLMTSGKRVESRQVEVSEFSRQIKLLAKELEIPVVALAQLNRGSEQRTDKRPMLSDLRESGSLEQDADMVILLHREEMYTKDSKRQGEADFIVAKHRNGATKTIPVAFQGHFSRFCNMHRVSAPPQAMP